jgi:hypothetical protein
MKLSDYYNKLEKSKEYQNFIKKNPKAYMCSCFFMSDKENNTTEIHFDYYIENNQSSQPIIRPTLDHTQIAEVDSRSRSPTIKSEINQNNNLGKMFSFKISPTNHPPTTYPANSEITFTPTEFFDKRIPEKLILDKKIELDYFEKLIFERMEKENVKEKSTKFLYSFQCVNGKNLLLATVFLSKLSLLKISIDVSKKEIIDFDKKSFFDIISFMKK